MYLRAHFKSTRFLFFHYTATTEIYTLSLHDALPIFEVTYDRRTGFQHTLASITDGRVRSEEHTSELQSLTNLVCRLLLEKKKHRNVHNTENNLKIFVI